MTRPLRLLPLALLCGASVLLTGAQAPDGSGTEPAPPPAALSQLLHQCPRLEEVLASERQDEPESDRVMREPGWWRSVKPQRSGDSVELRQEGSVFENARKVSLRTCSVLGYSWAFPYAGGFHVHVLARLTLYRDGRRVTWGALKPDERTALLALMRARQGAPGENTLAGVLFRAAETRHEGPAPAPALVPRRRLRLEPAFTPRDEGRVLIPCAANAPACDPGGSVLHLGSRAERSASLGTLDLYRVAFTVPRGPLAGRQHPQGAQLLLCDRKGRRCAYPFEGTGVLAFTPITRVTETAVRISARTGHFGTGSSQAHWLLDMASGWLYSLAVDTSGEELQPLLTEDEGGRHITWFSDGHGQVAEYAPLLASQGQSGVTTVAASEALAWGKAHGSAGTLLVAMLLARDEPASQAARAALRGLPGWKVSEDWVVGVSAAQRSARVVAGLGPRERVELEPRTHLVTLGVRGGEVFVLWREGMTGPWDAVLALPEESVLSIAALNRLAQLEGMMSEHEVCLQGEDGGCVPYPEAVRQALAQGKPSRQQRQRLCQAEELLLRGFRRTDLLELIDEQCTKTWWATPLEDESQGPPGPTPDSRCRAWKTLCAP